VNAKQGESCDDVRISPDRKHIGWFKIATQAVTDEAGRHLSGYTLIALSSMGRS
jgi:hypothetical protein